MQCEYYVDYVDLCRHGVTGAVCYGFYRQSVDVIGMAVPLSEPSIGMSHVCPIEEVWWMCDMYVVMCML